MGDADERLVTDLEAAIADAGMLLVRAQKYRRGAGPEGAALLHDALGLGDAARRLGRRGALDAAAATVLLAEAQALGERVRTLLGGVQAEPAYQAAVAAHAAGDQAALARLVPAVFHNLEPVSSPPALYCTVTWRRRNRPRPATEIVTEVQRTGADGLAAEGDDLSPGADPAIPAVMFEGDLPLDEPVVLRVAAGALPLPVYRLLDAGQYLVYAPRVRPRFEVLLATALDATALESAPVDYARYRVELAAAFGAAGIGFEDV